MENLLWNKLLWTFNIKKIHVSVDEVGNEKANSANNKKEANGVDDKF